MNLKFEVEPRVLISILAVATLDVAIWFFGWLLYSYTNSYVFIANVDYQNLLILFATLCSFVGLSLTIRKLPQKPQKQIQQSKPEVAAQTEPQKALEPKLEMSIAPKDSVKPDLPYVTIEGEVPLEPTSFFQTRKFLAMGFLVAVVVGVFFYFFILR